ncbi:hypothetical protein Hanom_Chr03g00268441 [Helianthus anomalus]
MWDKKNEGCKPYRDSSRAELGQARARLVYKSSRAGSFTTEPISSPVFFERAASHEFFEHP